MKKGFWILLLVFVLVSMTMAGCREGRQRVQSASAANTVLTAEEAKQIALKHAGLTEKKVLGLHAQYEIEHGTPIYDVEFHHGEWEFDYEIHADTGEILSFSKDG